MSAPATTTRVSTAPVASSAPAVSTARTTTPAASSIAATPTFTRITTHSSTRRHRTTTITSASSVIPTVVPFDPAEERQADSHKTNKILIGIFTSFGVIFLGLVAFHLFRRYKRKYREEGLPLPAPRDGQFSFRSRPASTYKDTRDLSRPPSMMMHQNSGSGLLTPSVRSNAPSMDIKVDENGRRISAPGHISRDYSPDNSLSGPALVPNDEELGKRRSPLGSRSGSPSNLSPSRPPSQGNPRPESRGRVAPPPSALVNKRQSSHGANRNSAYDPNRRSSFYGAPHGPNGRERVGLVMPQPLAPEASSYAPSSWQEGHGSVYGSSWGSRPNLAAGSDQDHQSLAPPRGPRPDSWVVHSHSSTTSLTDSPVTSDAPKDRTLPRGRDRSSRAETPRS